MTYNDVRSMIARIAGYAALICGAILALKLAGVQIPVGRDAGFWTSATVAAIALR